MVPKTFTFIIRFVQNKAYTQIHTFSLSFVHFSGPFSASSISDVKAQTLYYFKYTFT